MWIDRRPRTTASLLTFGAWVCASTSLHVEPTSATVLQHPRRERRICPAGVYPYGSVASFPVLFDNLCHRPLLTPVLAVFGHVRSHIAQARASPLRGPFLERATLPYHGPWPALLLRGGSSPKSCQALSIRRGSTVLPP